jgi:hypothetical protein
MLDIGILPWLSLLDVFQPDALLLGPFRQLRADIFRPIVDPYRLRFAAPLNNLD